jgi:hypothetical protein
MRWGFQKCPPLRHLCVSAFSAFQSLQFAFFYTELYQMKNLTRFTVALTALTLIASPAHAQLGGLMKKAAKAAAAKALDKGEGKAEQQGGESDASQPRSTTDSLYAIAHPTSADLQPLTAELLDQFFKGYADEHVMRQRDAACEKRAMETAEWKKISEEEYKSDARTEELNKLQRAYMLKTCDVDVDERDAGEYRITIAVSKTSGLTPRRYAMVRERVLAFAALAAKYNTSNFGGYRFSAAERAALSARMADVDKVLADYRG